MGRYIFYRQLNRMDCGPTCLKMIAKFYGREVRVETIKKHSGFSRLGVSLLGITDSAEKIGFRTRAVKFTIEQLKASPLPAILHWNNNHFVVLYKIYKRKVLIADPEKGLLSYSHKELYKYWHSSKNDENDPVGIALLLEPTNDFYNRIDEKEDKLSWKMVLEYLKTSRLQLIQVIIALLLSSFLSLLFPYLTQSIIDIGIYNHNLSFITLILVAQLVLAFSQTLFSFIRSRMLLRISNILNIQILSDFWIKLTRLPLSYFDSHQTGDIFQRINDHKTIQSFFTGSAISTIFSVFNFVVYTVVLILYNTKVFLVFLLGSIIYFLWIRFFLGIRRKINYENFSLSTMENNSTIQLVQGMQEIRLNNAERTKRWEWENIQSSIFRLSFRNLNYSQIQTLGATFIIQVQNIVISYFVAKLVLDGVLTLGAMFSIQYIVGQLNSPIQQWISFIQEYQDTRISMERINEIHQMPDEGEGQKNQVEIIPIDRNIELKDLYFSYPGMANAYVLEGVSFRIPTNKITAIVGASGSGKTSILKILLRIYDSYKGDIFIGEDNGLDRNTVRLTDISHKAWRSACASVLQDGYIFDDTIAQNIAVGCEKVDESRLIQSCKIANISSFIETLPNAYYTKLGMNGVGLSQGQKQRILIARAIYKDPAFLFLDEATNSLDSSNEKEIVQNLKRFFNQRTVIVVAHRLSTVKTADNIIVMHMGKVVEQGSHSELFQKAGKYYELVKNQLELEIK